MATNTFSRTGNRKATFDGSQIGSTQQSSGSEFTMKLFQNDARIYFTYQSAWLNRVFFGTVEQVTQAIQSFDPTSTFEGTEEEVDALIEEYWIKVKALWDSLPAETINP